MKNRVVMTLAAVCLTLQILLCFAPVSEVYYAGKKTAYSTSSRDFLYSYSEFELFELYNDGCNRIRSEDWEPDNEYAVKNCCEINAMTIGFFISLGICMLVTGLVNIKTPMRSFIAFLIGSIAMAILPMISVGGLSNYYLTLEYTSREVTMHLIGGMQILLCLPVFFTKPENEEEQGLSGSERESIIAECMERLAKGQVNSPAFSYQNSAPAYQMPATVPASPAPTDANAGESVYEAPENMTADVPVNLSGECPPDTFEAYGECNKYTAQTMMPKVEYAKNVVRFCPNCGEMITRSSFFCSKCGTKL